MLKGKEFWPHPNPSPKERELEGWNKILLNSFTNLMRGLSD